MSNDCLGVAREILEASMRPIVSLAAPSVGCNTCSNRVYGEYRGGEWVFALDAVGRCAVCQFLEEEVA